MKKTFIENWILTDTSNGDRFAAHVPGDITADLFRAGKIPDPYYADNHLKLEYVVRKNYTYSAEFDVDKKLLAWPEVVLSFGGVDLFSDIVLNGTLLGSTNNMFLEYSYDVKSLLKEKGNRLEVKMYSTLVRAEQNDLSRYFGVFDVRRVLLRKAQCHFGWDWAFDMPGYGIYKPVTIEGRHKHRIESVRVDARCDGWVTIQTRLNYLVHYIGFDPIGNPCSYELKEGLNDVLRVSIERRPNGGFDDAIVSERALEGKKNFVNIRVEDPQLWWPVGYGEHPLYRYRVEVIRDGEVISMQEGKFAFREVELVERPVDTHKMTFALRVNGSTIRVRGSNWVPTESFTGTVTEEKYRKLITLAADANFNMLRLWGGGLYENDVFYDICDELGIAVWQDFMTACADIPEDDPEWLANMTAECRYQLLRLRNHPSILIWCGGNEKTGTYGQAITMGDTFVNCTLRGIVNHLDGTRPYISQSPFSYSDGGNDLDSGDSHRSSYEGALAEGIAIYGKLVASKTPPFVSECAVMGPCETEFYSRIFPNDKLWPMNELWDDRLMDNPYAAIKMKFSERQLKLTTELYGEPKSLDSFVAKGMQLHAETLKLEFEHNRCNRYNSGILNWMFSDDWPTASWAIVDYYCRPKQAYYQLKRTNAPTAFVFDGDGLGGVHCCVVNDTFKSKQVKARVCVKCADGTVIEEKNVALEVVPDGVAELTTLNITDKAFYVSVVGTIDGEPASALFSPNMWSGMPLIGDIEYSVNLLDDHCAEVTVKAKNGLVKSVAISVKGQYNGNYSDNYFDIETGESKMVTVECDAPIEAKDITVTHFAKRTAGDDR